MMTRNECEDQDDNHGAEQKQADHSERPSVPGLRIDPCGRLAHVYLLSLAVLALDAEAWRSRRRGTDPYGPDTNQPQEAGRHAPTHLHYHALRLNINCCSKSGTPTANVLGGRLARSRWIEHDRRAGTGPIGILIDLHGAGPSRRVRDVLEFPPGVEDGPGINGEANYREKKRQHDGHPDQSLSGFGSVEQRRVMCRAPNQVLHGVAPVGQKLR